MHPFQPKKHPKKGSYNKGQERVLQILQAARDILIESGYHSLTMRKIAAAVGITLGNLQYYYPSKQDLLTDLLDHVIDSYMVELDMVRHKAGDYPEDQLAAVVRYFIDDDGTRESTSFFPELWALSNHDAHAAERMFELYRKARLDFNDLISQINPKLSPKSREQIALFISASIEGLVPFVGYGKPFNSDIPAIKNIAVKSFINLVKLATNEDIAELELDESHFETVVAG